MNYFIENTNNVKEDYIDAKISIWKQLLLLGFVIFFLASVCFKLLNYSVLNHSTFVTKAKDNYLTKKYILPERGLIYSSNLNSLVENVPVYNVVIDLNKLDRFKTYKSINEFLPSSLISVLIENKVAINDSQISKINLALKEGKEYFPLKIFYNQNEFSVLSSKLQDFGEANKISIVNSSIRNYKDPFVFSHILGYVNYVNKESLENDSWYTPSAKIGVLGLEGSYEKYLRGEKGESTLVYNSRYSLNKHSVTKEPISGNSIVTTIDANLQNTAYKSLENQIKKVSATAGSVVVQNPNTGEVLALVNYPSYDINQFSKGLTNDYYSSLLSDYTKPLLNRGIDSAFPPGSTFKVVTALAGLSEKSLKSDTTIVDKGVINIGNFSYKTWKAGGHGVINVTDAIKESSDIFFYVLGGGHSDYPQIAGLGPWKLYKWSKLFGFGTPLGIDISGEEGGFVAEPDWKQKTFNESWYVGNTYHFAIGQGFVTATPLQVNTMINAIANGGIIYKPYLVKQVINTKDNSEIKKFDPTVITKLNVSKDDLDLIKEGLVRASSPGGTAYPLFNYKVPVAGKTGTAEFGPKKKDGTYPTHAWYTAFAPANNPQISVTVFIENGGGGSDNAAPVAKEVFDEFFKDD